MTVWDKLESGRWLLDLLGKNSAVEGYAELLDFPPVRGQKGQKSGDGHFSAF
jgi:hypothetical protein